MGIDFFAEEGDGVGAEEVVDGFDVDEHAGGGVELAGDGGGEDEEGVEAE